MMLCINITGVKGCKGIPPLNVLPLLSWCIVQNMKCKHSLWLIIALWHKTWRDCACIVTTLNLPIAREGCANFDGRIFQLHQILTESMHCWSCIVIKKRTNKITVGRDRRNWKWGKRWQDRQEMENHST